MALYECTRFPNLCNSAKVPTAPATKISIDLDAPSDILYLAWGYLLKAYSGEEHEVTFFSDDGVVRVDVTEWCVQAYEEIDIPISNRGNSTGVYYKKTEHPHGHALHLYYEKERGVGTLSTSGHVPENHLEQLGIQLRNAIGMFDEKSTENDGVQSNTRPYLSILNGEPKLLDGPRLLHDLVFHTKHDNQLAIEFWDHDWNISRLTYSELDLQTHNLATRISSFFNGSQSSSQPIIPLYIPQSAALYVAMIAVLKVGCAFCPLQLDAPPERLRFVLGDLSASLVLTTSELEGKLAAQTELTCLVIDDRTNDHQTDLMHKFRPIETANNAYVMYTSGSTGQPKGVIISHHAASQSLLAHERHIPPFSRFLQFAAPTFDVSLFEIFFTLYRGSTLVSCDRSVLLGDLPSAMRRMEVDAAELTPTVAAGLLQSRANVPTLKLLLTIGEMLTTPVIDEFSDVTVQDSILWGMYGPTEAAIHCTLQAAFSPNSRPTNIGVPFDTVSAFVLAPAVVHNEEEEIEVLPIGHVGELAIGGHQLAGGYLNRPEQTAQAFITSQTYGHLYRTGDKARILPDGSIECLGRMSSGQVKLRGQRIEFGEVQYAATRTSGCRDAVASVIGGTTLVVFCLVEGKETIAQDIIATCRQWLPEFMVPGDVVLVTEFPCLPSGKVDKSRLEQQYNQYKISNDDLVDSPAGEAQVICKILERRLGHRITASTLLTSSGIDSLSAIQSAGDLRRAGFSVSPLELLESIVVGELFKRLKERQTLDGTVNGNHSDSARKEIESELQDLVMENPLLQQLGHKVARVSICTPIQVSMLSETMRNTKAYCNSIELEFPSNFNISNIKEAVGSLVAANEILRSGFCRLGSPDHPFARITWKELTTNQIVITNESIRPFSINDEEALLHPIRFFVSRRGNELDSSYCLLIHLHHALYDGWSMDLIIDDLNALATGQSLKNRPQFTSVANHYLKTNSRSTSEYWQENLHEYRPVSMPNFNGRTFDVASVGSQDFQFSTPLAALQERARTFNLSPQTFFQGALAYILSGYLGTSDVSIGTVISGRTIAVPDIEDIIGPCMTSLPLRVDVSQSKRVIDLLRYIHKMNRQMLRHADLPLRSIKNVCRLDITANLWDVLFVWQETIESRSSSKQIVKLLKSSDNIESALTFEVEPRRSSLVGKATYHSSILPASQVRLLFDQIDELVKIFVQGIDMPLAEVIPQLPNKSLSIANPKPEMIEFNHGLCEAVERHACTTPDSSAILFAPSLDFDATVSLTYAELNVQANRLAHMLNARLERSTDIIGICMEKSLNLYVAILAVLKTGRGYLPLAPGTPQQRIMSILEEAKVELCVSDSDTSSVLGLGNKCAVIDMNETDLSRFSVHNPRIPYDGSRAAYTVFTSGSTGKPKGLLVSQHNLMSNLKVLFDIYPTSPNDRLLQACSQAFDVSVFEVFFTWFAGMCLCSARNDVLFADIEDTIRKLGISHLSLTPTVAALIDPSNVPSVQFLVTAGEAVTEKVKRKWAGRGLYQGYGPSETTNICTVKVKVLGSDLTNNIGPPFKNTSCFVVAPYTEIILPAGALGELCFGGEQVFLGYLNNPQLTDSKIINHIKYGRLYRSGDTGRLLPDGTILFSSRLDDQVKIRGQRIELGEINDRLLQSPEIVDCATIILEDGRSKTKVLVSFWLPQAHSSGEASVIPINPQLSATIKTLFEDLTAALPAYMVPNALIPLSAIPMTSQGKIDQRRLKSFFDTLDNNTLESTGQNFDENEQKREWTNLELVVAQALSRSVQIPVTDVKQQSSFFSMGLDSISAISLSKALQGSTTAPVPVSTILQNPTVARLARKLESNTAEEKDKVDLSTIFGVETIDSVQRRLQAADFENDSKILPCTALQEAMLSASQSRVSDMYCNTMVFKVHQNLSRLQQCWNFMSARHDALRTCFVSTSSATYPFAQVVLPNYTPKWIIRDLKSHSDILEAAKSIATTSLPPPIDSFQPAYILAILHCESYNYIQFSCHHALQDGTAMAILLHEIELNYDGKPLPELCPSEPFLEEMVCHRSPRAIEFWTKQMLGFQPIVLENRGERHVSFSKVLKTPFTKLEGASQGLNVSLLTLTQVAWTKTLHSLFNEPDICFGNVVSGRTLDLAHLENLVAPTFNTIPIRVNIDRHQSNSDLLRHVQELNSDILSFQLTPLRSIQSRLGFGGSGLFSTLLLFQQASLELDTSLWTLETEFGEMDFPVILELIPNRANDTLLFTLYYEDSLFTFDHCLEVFDIFTQAITSCIDYPAADIRDFDGVSEKIVASIRGRTSRPVSANSNLRNKIADVVFTPAQEEICRILVDLAHVTIDRLRPDTTIHQIGLDSISAIQLASRLSNLKGIQIAAADILERPAITDLAEMLQKRKIALDHQPRLNFQMFENLHKRKICSDLGVQSDQIESIRPCTPLQNGLITQFIRSQSLYVNHIAYLLESGWTSSSLFKAWYAASNAHTLLRTGFVSIDDPKLPYGMVTYAKCDLRKHFEVVDETTNVHEWRIKRTAEFHDQLDQPPWAILVVMTKNGPVMHLTLFHGLYDAHSLDLILGGFDLTTTYNVRVSSIDPVLTAILSSSHSDNKPLDDQARESFWKETLENVTINKFPNLTPLRSATGKTAVCSRLCAKPLKELESSCSEQGVSLQAAGQAAWARLLSTYIGEQDVTFGVVLSGRDTVAGAEEVAFPCITTVPVPAVGSGDNRELLNSMMQYNSNIRKHQFTPMKDIQRWTGHANQPLFDTIFAFQKLSSTQMPKAWKVVDEVATVEYEISIELEPQRNGDLLLRITFALDLIPVEQADILLQQFEALLNNLVMHPQGHRDDTLFLDHHKDLLSLTPAKSPTLSSPVQLLHQFVELGAHRHPQRIAFQFVTRISSGLVEQQSWTYKELDEEGNMIADLISQQGIVPGSLIAICFDKCPEGSFAILGIMKAGCAYVALDPGAPFSRKSFIISDSGAKLVLTLNRSEKHFIPASESGTSEGTMLNGSVNHKKSENINVPILYLDELSISTASGVKPHIAGDQSPDSTCYCLYTSGTTGIPKGCEITHENAVQAMRAFSLLFSPRWNQNSRWLQFASFHFDVSVLEQYWSWSEGIRVVSAPRDLIFEDLAGTIRALGITHIDLTPSLASLLQPDDVPRLCEGVFITGGEQLKQDILDVWGPTGVIHNGYGPTEATIGVTMFTGVPENGKPANIGRQFDNVGSYVLQPNRYEPVLRGGIGELCVSGKLVGRGYLNRPELTKEKFPFVDHFNERIYRTGDLVRLLWDGSFLFLGRADDQVKLRGQRLEIGEINSTIRQGIANISDVSTFVLKHPKQQRDQLVTFFVKSNGKKYTGESKINLDTEAVSLIDQVQDACRAKLPAYMTPTHFIPLTNLPLTANNKTDARTLERLFNDTSFDQLQALSTKGDDQRALSSAEKNVVTVLGRVLSIEMKDILPRSNIFELGMDSISIIRFTRALKTAGFHSAQPSLVMTNGTIKSLAKALQNESSSRSDRTAVLDAQQAISACHHRHRAKAARELGITTKDIAKIAPCTPLQEGMISKSLDSEEPVYFASFRYALAKDTNVSRLHRAWNVAIERIQVLRTKFLPTDDGYIQVVLHRDQLFWHEISATDEEELDRVQSLRLKKWRQRNRSTFSQPLQVLSLRTQDQSFMVINIFHGLYDGNSLPLLLSFVLKLYEGDTNPDSGPKFQDVLAYGPLLRATDARKFWTRHIANPGLFSLRPLGDQISSRMETSRVVVNFEDIDQLESSRRKLNVAPQAIIQACFTAAMLKYFTGPVSFGLVVSGRSIDFDGADRVIGPLFNTIPFQYEVNSQDTWKSAVERCHVFNAESLSYQHTPLRDIQKWCKVGTERRLFDVLFVFEKETEESLNAKNNSLWTAVDDQSVADYPLAFEAEMKLKGSLTITLVSQSHIADSVALDQLADNFNDAMIALMNDPDGLISATVGEIRVRPATNGVNENTAPELNNNFTWTQEAELIRRELSALAGIGVDEITAHVSIFELGLDSIDSIKISSRLSKLGLNLPVSSIMRNPSIRQMVAVAQSTEDFDDENRSSILDDWEGKLTQSLKESNAVLLNVDSILPVTPLQEAMVAEMMSSNFSRYYNHDILRLYDNTNVQKLRSAWQAVYDYSEILRTTFRPISDPNIDSTFAQVIMRNQELPWYDISTSPLDGFDTILGNIREEVEKSNVTSSHLRLSFCNSSSEHFLILSIPHALYDGWSLALLHHDVQCAYNDRLDARPTYRSALQDILRTSNQVASDFWSDYLSEAQPCLLEKKQVLKAVVHRKELKSKLSVKDLRTFCRTQGITMQALGQTCWSLVLASYVGGLEVVFGVVLSGRDTEEAQKVMFPTMNTIVFRQFIHGTVGETLKRTQDDMSNIREFQHFPLRTAQRFAKTDGRRLFDSLYLYQSQPELPDQDGGRLYESVGSSSDVEFPVCVEMETVGDALIWRAACEDQVFGETGTLDMLTHLDDTLKKCVEEVNNNVVANDRDKVRILGLPAFNIPQSSQQLDTASPSTLIADEDVKFSDLELKIRSVLSAVSGTPEEDVTKHATLFHIGLDSISAIKVSALLRKQSITLSVSNMLKASTLEGMARFIEGADGIDSEIQTSLSDFASDEPLEFNVAEILDESGLRGRGLEERHIEQIIPVTSGQVYMLSAWDNSKGRLFHDEFKFSVDKSASAENIHREWIRFVSTNAILRTAFITTSDDDHPFLQLVLKSKDTNAMTANAESGFLTAGECLDIDIAKADLTQPFAQLSHKRTQNGEWELGLKIHHALYDGVSLPALLSTLRASIEDPNAQDKQEPNTPSSPFAQFAARAHKSRLSSQAKDFWTQYLAGTETSAPAKKPTSGKRTAKYTPKLIPDGDALAAFAQRNGIALPALFLAVYARLHARRTSSTVAATAIVGVYVANRDNPEGDELAASPTVNLLPLRVDVGSGVLDAARSVQRDLALISEAANVDVGLWQLEEWTGVRVDTFVNYLRLPGERDHFRREVRADESALRDDYMTDSAPKVGDDGQSAETDGTASLQSESTSSSSSSSFSLPRELFTTNDIRVQDAYLPSIDVEVALRDGALDVGVFGPEEMLDTQQAGHLLQEIHDELAALVRAVE